MGRRLRHAPAERARNEMSPAPEMELPRASAEATSAVEQWVLEEMNREVLQADGRLALFLASGDARCHDRLDAFCRDPRIRFIEVANHPGFAPR